MNSASRQVRSSRRLATVLVVLALAALFSVAPRLRAANYTITAASPDSVDLSNVGLLPGDTVFLQAHTRQRLILQNLTAGTAENPICIVNTNGQFIIDTTNTDKGLHFYNCRNFVLRGVPSPGNYDYGIKIARVSQAGAIGLAFVQGCTDFEVSHIEIANVGFAGVMAKSDNLDRTEFTMRNVSFHHLYIHDTGGEAIYVGNSAYYDTTLNPHEIHGVAIYNNVISNAGWDGIQLGCATENAAVYGNRIVGYGAADLLNPNHAVQNEGIRINPGTTARVFGNWIQGGNPGAGSGIFANPHDDSVYFNNVILAPGESGIVISTDSAQNPGTTIALLNNTIVSPLHHGIEFWSLASTNNVALNNFIVNPGTNYVFERYAGVDLSTDSFLHTNVAGAGFLNAAGGNYQLASNSPAINAGSNVLAFAVTNDFAGVTRPFGAAFDVGAYEYFASPTGEPIIAAQPWSQTVAVGSDVALKVIAAGNAPLTYQWRKDGTLISGATNAVLAFSAVALTNAGSYVVMITNSLGAITSAPALLTVTAPPPVITSQPASQTIKVSSNATFTVVASGEAPLAYQWRKDAGAIPAATNAILLLTNVPLSAAGNYSVIVTNPGGAVTSSVAVLTVSEQPLPAAYSVTTLVSDATAIAHVNASNTYTHAININAASVVTVNGLAFGYGTGNGGGSQPAKQYAFSTFNNAINNFASSATGNINTLLATRATHTTSATYTLTLSNLVAGRRYTLALFNDSSHGAGRNWYRVSQNVDNVTFDVDFSAGGVGSSRMLVASYTAIASSVTFTFTRLDGVGTTDSGSWVGFAGFVNYRHPDAYLDWTEASSLPVNQRSPSADPDGDGVKNLFEFIFGTNPLLISTNEITIAFDTFAGVKHPVITFPRRQVLGNVGVTVWVTGELNSTNNLGSVEVSSISQGNGTDLVAVRSAQPADAQPRQFFQLKASYLPN